jgi:thioredoxin-related protein
MKPFIFLFLITSFLTLYAKNLDKNYKEPIQNTHQLDSLSNLNNKPFDKNSIVVIYTYLSCKPCQVLAQKIQKKLNQPEYLKRIVFVNDIDIAFNPEKVKQSLNSKAFPFPYFMTKQPQITGTYPLICFYDEHGNLINTVKGYRSSYLTLIKNFLQDSASSSKKKE